jgi:hypothetical protein
MITVIDRYLLVVIISVVGLMVVTIMMTLRLWYQNGCGNSVNKYGCGYSGVSDKTAFIFKNTNHQQMHKESLIINRNTLLHVSTLLGHLQGELLVTVTLRLHFTVE